MRREPLSQSVPWHNPSANDPLSCLKIPLHMHGANQYFILIHHDYALARCPVLAHKDFPVP